MIKQPASREEFTLDRKLLQSESTHPQALQRRIALASGSKHMIPTQASGEISVIGGTFGRGLLRTFVVS
jgi:hypothetical protein